MNRNALLLAVAVVVVAVVGVWLIGDEPHDGPLDPRSHGEAGTSALVALLEDLGADVDIQVRSIDPAADTALLLVDRLGDVQRAEVRDWVRDGGTLVVTDPSSPFVPFSDGFETLLTEDPEALERNEPVRVDAGDCDVPPFEEQDLDTLSVWGGALRYDVGSGDRSCFGNGSTAYVVVTPVGDGNVVSFGGSGAVVNRTLDEADNAPAIANLLAPSGGTRVAVMDLAPGPTSGGEQTLLEVMPTWAKRVAVQLALAFLVYVVWRARRLGRPVAEPQPVKVAASELVAARGSMLERSGSPQHAADVLRAELRRDLVRRLGLPPNVAPATLVELVGPRTRLDGAQLAAALGPGPVSDDKDLLTVVTLIDIVRKEVFVHVGS